jgi:histidine triad (HIT) family protein
MQEDSIFTKIIKGEIPAYKIYEDDQVLAFLDVHPVQPGHVLGVPKKQIDKIEDLDEQLYVHLWLVVKMLMKHVVDKLPDKRVTLKTEGFDVPHVHIHLIPCSEPKDFWRKTRFDDPIDHAALSAMQQKLSLIK